HGVAVGVELVQSEGPVSLDGDPVTGVRLGDGTVLRADLVVTCAGDVPVTDWLDGHAWAGPQGVEIDHGGRTPLEGVLAAGDVAAVREEAGLRRRPFWSNAVAQGRLAAATLLGDEPGGPVWDDYFWSEVCGHSLKMVGPVPRGEPEVLAGDPCTGSSLLRWWDGDVATVVAVDHRIPVPRLRALALERERA
ncbi:MAG: ferredoxin reductase, partial [Actinomycetales bacterium]